MIIHMNVHKNKKMLGTILKDNEHSITFKIKCERPEIQDVNVSLIVFICSLNLLIIMKKLYYSFINIINAFL